MKEISLKSIRSLHNRKLRELIEEYSNRDYEIFADYRDYKRPRRIGNWIPDLIVKRENLEIVIEIVSRTQLPDLKEKLEQLAQYADKTKDVRFDIVFTNPKVRMTKSEYDITYHDLLDYTQRSLINDARASYERGQYYVAFYLFYNVLDSMLKEIAIRHRIPLSEGGRTSIENVSLSLRNNNVIDEPNYRLIGRIKRERDKIAHYGFKEERDKMILENTRKLCETLMKNL